MTASWPGTLPPALQIGGYQESWLDQWIETQMSDGFPPKRRQRFSQNMFTVDSTLTMTQTQYQTFQTFWNTTLNAGALPFSWTLPTSGNTVNMLFMSKPTWKALTPTLYQLAFKIGIYPP